MHDTPAEVAGASRGDSLADAVLDALSVAVFDVRGGVSISGRASTSMASLHCGRTCIGLFDHASADSLLPSEAHDLPYSDIVRCVCHNDRATVTIETASLGVTLHAPGVGKSIAYFINRRMKELGNRHRGASNSASALGRTLESPGSPVPRDRPSDASYASLRCEGRVAAVGRSNVTAAVSILDTLMGGGSAPRLNDARDFTSSHLVRGAGESPSEYPFVSVPALLSTKTHTPAPGDALSARFLDPSGEKTALAYPQMAALPFAAQPGAPVSVSIGGDPAAARKIRHLEAALEDQLKELGALRSQVERLSSATTASTAAAKESVHGEAPQAAAGVVQPPQETSLVSSRGVLDFDAILKPILPEPTRARPRMGSVVLSSTAAPTRGASSEKGRRTSLTAINNTNSNSSSSSYLLPPMETPSTAAAPTAPDAAKIRSDVSSSESALQKNDAVTAVLTPDASLHTSVEVLSENASLTAASTNKVAPPPPPTNKVAPPPPTNKVAPPPPPTNKVAPPPPTKVAPPPPTNKVAPPPPPTNKVAPPPPTNKVAPPPPPPPRAPTAAKSELATELARRVSFVQPH